MYYYIDNRPSTLSMDFLDEVLDFGQYYLGLDSDFIIKLVFLSDLGKQVWGYCNGLEDEDYVIEISSNINTFVPE